MSTGQTHLSKGNFPINLDNVLSIVQFPFWNKHDHSEQCSSKFPDFVLGRHDNYNLQSCILSRRVFWVFSLLLFSFFALFKQAEVSVRWALWNKHGDREGTIFFQAPHHARVCFDLRSARARLKNIKRKKFICFTRYLRERKSPPFLDQSERTSNLCQAVSQWWRYK